MTQKTSSRRRTVLLLSLAYERSSYKNKGRKIMFIVSIYSPQRLVNIKGGGVPEETAAVTFRGLYDTR